MKKILNPERKSENMLMNKRKCMRCLWICFLCCSAWAVNPVVSNEKAFADDVKNQALGWMRHLEGWCSDIKGTTLIDLVLKKKPEVVVEIGVRGGKSLVPMACALKALGKGVIYGIDPWDNNASIEEAMEPINRNFWHQVDHQSILDGLVAKIHHFEIDEHVVLLRNTSESAPNISNIDVLHIDGNHAQKTSYLDVTKWVPLMNAGGWIVFDDMTWYENGVYTTAKAVEWLDEHCAKVAEFTDMYCTWGIWVKP